MKQNTLRVSFNGRTSASQAENEGSIPFTRSNLLCRRSGRCIKITQRLHRSKRQSGTGYEHSASTGTPLSFFVELGRRSVGQHQIVIARLPPVRADYEVEAHFIAYRLSGITQILP